MHIHIFAEGSTTKAENSDIELKNYYCGLFREVKTLETSLSKYGDVEMHIVSERFGTASGDEQAENIINKKIENPLEAIQFDLRSAADGDVVVILLTADIFTNTVGEIWPELIEKAAPDSIWCLGASRSALNSVPLEQLEDEGRTLITYQRVGVARLGREARERLYERVQREAENKA